MFVWRISKYCDLSGRGGLTAPGRWHTHPKAIVYCADEPQSALAEKIRQVSHASLIPDSDQLMKISIPDNIEIEEVRVSDLDPRWSDKVHGWKFCRPIGDRWFATLSSTVLKVPSAARPGSSNYLLNTVSANIGDIKITQVIAQPFSADLFR